MDLPIPKLNAQAVSLDTINTDFLEQLGLTENDEILDLIL